MRGTPCHEYEMTTSKAVTRARTLRRDQTEPEKRIWERIRNSSLGAKFRRQVPLGPYFADFFCLELKLVVEIDGGQHSESQRDAVRTKYLEGAGFKVVRFWNSEVMESLEGVVAHLEKVIAERRIEITR